MAADKIKKWLFIGMLAILCLPMLQQKLHPVDIGVLKGSYYLAPKPEFSKDKWFDASYQGDDGKYINDNFGFHQYFVRLNNQIDFSFFKATHAADVVVGKDNYLFQGDYIKDHFAENRPDKDHAKDLLLKLKALQDTLERMGKTLVLAYAPSKADFYPEYLPAHPPADSGGNPYIDVYKHIADSFGIHQVDFNAWFLKLKQKNTRYIMSREGIHWTVCGAMYAADSLIRYLEGMRHISMPKLVVTKMEYTDTAKVTDDDLAQIINLIFPVAHDTFCYPEIIYTGDSTKTKPKAIYIGDSFIWTLITDGLMKNTNTDWKFWYYFHEEINQKTMDNGASGIPMDQIDWTTSLLNTDCVVLLYTSHNLNELGNGFIEKAYDHFYPSKK
jgi:hypothetical protein